MAAASPSTSDAAERLARLVQRLRRLVRGELILAGGHARLQPQDETDVATALELARELAVPVRFGGVTGGLPAVLAGHVDSSRGSLPGLRIDASSHLTRAARFDGTRGMIEVQPGVRLADLNRLLQPHGWWLPIETHPESGATLGGLVGLDAAAAAPAWGTLADRLLGIDAILDDGTRQLFGPFGERSSVSLNSGRAGQLVSSLFGIAAGVQADMARHWPPGQRVPDGYLLDAFHPRPQRPYTPDGSVNLAHLLAGSAGTLAWSARLHLRLLRRPAVSRWALFLQPSAAAALTHAPAVLALQPSAALLLDAADLRRLAGSHHPDDQALCRLAGIGPGMSGRPDGTQQGEAG
ncbi:MAG: FAD-binding oxidoreductase, partial [Lautropia sp.]